MPGSLYFLYQEQYDLCSRQRWMGDIWVWAWSDPTHPLIMSNAQLLFNHVFFNFIFGFQRVLMRHGRQRPKQWVLVICQCYRNQDQVFQVITYCASTSDSTFTCCNQPANKYSILGSQRIGETHFKLNTPNFQELLYRFGGLNFLGGTYSILASSFY